MCTAMRTVAYLTSFFFGTSLTAKYKGRSCSSYIVGIIPFVCFVVHSLYKNCFQCFDAVGWAARRASGL